MVLSVPFGQTTQIVVDGVIDGHLFRMDIQLDVLLGRSVLTNVFALGLEDDAVQHLLGQRSEDAWGDFQFFNLPLSVQHVTAEMIVLIQERLYAERSNHLGTMCLLSSSFFVHSKNCLVVSK